MYNGGIQPKIPLRCAKTHERTLARRKTLRAKLVVLSTCCATPGSPALMNFEPYWIARQILSRASALLRYITRKAISDLATSIVAMTPGSRNSLKFPPRNWTSYKQCSLHRMTWTQWPCSRRSSCGRLSFGALIWNEKQFLVDMKYEVHSSRLRLHQPSSSPWTNFDGLDLTSDLIQWL